MQTFLIYWNTFIFILLAGIHIYWVFGGSWGFKAALPILDNDQPAIKPGVIATLTIAIGLLLFAAVIYSNISYHNKVLVKYTTYGISFIFLLRGIGDFKLFGLFKKIKNNTFAKNDTRIYTPLCFYLAVSCFIIASH
jgi:hypothetical protein